jgi:hypothetical protein
VFPFLLNQPSFKSNINFSFLFLGLLKMSSFIIDFINF